MTSRTAFFICLSLSVAMPTARCGTVLSINMPGPVSHLFGMKKIAEEVAARGHTLKILVLDNNAYALQPTDIPVLTYSITVAKGPMDPAKLRVTGPQTFESTVPDLTKLFISGCESMLSNSTLMAQLKDFSPELLLGETLSPCTQVMASRLDIPFVNFQMYAPLEPFQTSMWRTSNRNEFNPNPLSYFPQRDSGITTQYMSFGQRLYNFAKHWQFHVQDYIHVKPIVQSAFKKFGVHPDAPKERRRMLLTLCIADWAIEWLRPLPPSFKLIGAVLPEPARPLPADLEAFMDGAGDDGVLLVAMGTIATLGPEELRSLATTFAELPVRILWRLSKSEVPDAAAVAALNVGNNTKVVTWLPQNDVLGHPRTMAFLSHCGINGLYEAAFHGVPIAALPFLAEQQENADKAVGRGMALRLYHEEIRSARFSDTIKRVLTEPAFRLAAQRISVKLRARPRTPTQEAADWVEHALVTGGEAYLRTPDQDLLVLVKLSIDVWAAYLGAGAVLIYLAFLLTHLVLKRLDAALARSVTLANAQFDSAVQEDGGKADQTAATDAVADDNVASQLQNGSVKHGIGLS